MTEIVELRTKRKAKLAKVKKKLELECLDLDGCELEVDEAMAAQIAEDLADIKKTIKVRKKNGTNNS